MWSLIFPVWYASNPTRRKNSLPLDNLCYNSLTMNHTATVFTTEFNTAPVGIPVGISVGGVVALR